MNYHTLLMGTPKCCTVILFLENGFKFFIFGFLRQFWTNRAEFLIWCTKCINEEPLTPIFWKFKKIFPNFPDFPKSFLDLMKFFFFLIALSLFYNIHYVASWFAIGPKIAKMYPPPLEKYIIIIIAIINLLQKNGQHQMQNQNNLRKTLFDHMSIKNAKDNKLKII